MKAGSRRSFLGQTLPAVGLLASSLRPRVCRAEGTANASELELKGVNFLRPRQGEDGSWSSDRKEPGITGVVVAALLRSGRVTPDDPTVIKGRLLSRTLSRSHGRPHRGASLRLCDLCRHHGLSGSK